MKIKSVLVVGGGSSGWMTAAALCKFFKDTELKVSLVESKNIKTIGVGESTIASINTFLDILELKDEEWMPPCEATYKNSIRFTDFREKDTVFEYPFGGDFSTYENQIMTWAELAAKHNLPPESFSEFFNENTFLAQYNRCTKNEKGYLDSFNFKSDTAYHFDAELFGKFLKENICIPSGMEYNVDDIISCEKNEDGYLVSITGESGKTYSADLFVDCTGFKSLLLEQEMGSEFVSFKPWLMNDRALATCIPYVDKEEEIHNVTNCTAIENGWVWDIPLWSRIGTGYVYSSDFVDDETAEKEFRNHLARDPRFAERAENAVMRKINIRHGMRKEAWVKNVVGIGLAYGFVEPLESTGLVSTHSNIIRLLDVLQRRNFHLNRFDLDTYNLSASHELEGFRDFVAMHYMSSSRDDTKYWKHVCQEQSYHGLETKGQERMTNGMTFTDSFRAFSHFLTIHKVWTPPMGGWVYIMAGMGYKPLGKYMYDLICEQIPGKDERTDSNLKEWLQHRENLIEYVKTLPSHYEFLKENIYNK